MLGGWLRLRGGPPEDMLTEELQRSARQMQGECLDFGQPVQGAAAGAHVALHRTERIGVAE